MELQLALQRVRSKSQYDTSGYVCSSVYTMHLEFSNKFQCQQQIKHALGITWPTKPFHKKIGATSPQKL